jgi:hypothetical protein
MAVIFYQLAIFATLIFVRFAFPKRLLTAALVWSALTVINLFYPPLIIIQLAVIWGSFRLLKPRVATTAPTQTLTGSRFEGPGVIARSPTSEPSGKIVAAPKLTGAAVVDTPVRKYSGGSSLLRRGPPYERVIRGVAASRDGKGYLQVPWDDFAQYLRRKGIETNTTGDVVSAFMLVDGRRHSIILERDKYNENKCTLSVVLDEYKSPTASVSEEVSIQQFITKPTWSTTDKFVQFKACVMIDAMDHHSVAMTYVVQFMGNEDSINGLLLVAAERERGGGSFEDQQSEGARFVSAAWEELSDAERQKFLAGDDRLENIKF